MQDSSNFKSFLKNGPGQICPRVSCALCSQLRRQIHNVLRNDVKLARIRFIRLTRRSVFTRSVDEPGAQSETAGSVEIADVRRDHHDFVRLQTKKLDGSQISLAIGFVMTGEFG